MSGTFVMYLAHGRFAVAKTAHHTRICDFWQGVAIAPCAAATTAAPKSTILLLPALLLLAVLLIPLLPLLLLLLTPLLRQFVSAASSAHSATTVAHPVLAYLPHSPRPCLPFA